MANRIIGATDDGITFEVDAQSYKAGRFTMPAEVLRRLGLDWNEEVRLRIESMDGHQVLWAGTIRMQSGPEIDSAELVQHVGPGERIRVIASRS
jgi:hypothetical protein